MLDKLLYQAYYQVQYRLDSREHVVQYKFSIILNNVCTSYYCTETLKLSYKQIFFSFKMDSIKCRIASVVLISIVSNAWCHCTCTTTPQTYEYISLDRGRQISRILHHSVCMAVIEPVVMGTPFDLRSDFTVEPCCCKAFWRHVVSSYVS
jgi:hypothetical protein